MNHKDKERGRETTATLIDNLVTVGRRSGRSGKEEMKIIIK